jgi:epoxyqueuosine reductase QueG
MADGFILLRLHFAINKDAPAPWSALYIHTRIEDSVNMKVIGLAQELRELSIRDGADLFGVADADCFLEQTYRGNKPQDFMENVRSVVIVAVAIPSGAVDPLPKGRAEYTNTLMAATVTLRSMSFRIARRLEKRGFKASIVPNEGSEFGYWYADKRTLMADLSVKWAAYHAGLGNYGINHLLITPEYGPRVRLTAILTDAVMEHGTAIMPLINEKCLTCQRCLRVCPVQALHANGEIDKHKCADYMFTQLGGMRCGLCLKACPV